MIQGVYTVRDEPSGAFMGLQLNQNDEVAIRSFDFAMQSNEIMRFHPEDFSLWLVGEYDDQTGCIQPFPPKKIKQGVKKSGRNKV